MCEDSSGTIKERNVAAYSSPEATELYIENARSIGLSAAEKEVLDVFFTPPTGTVLDIGCGAGRTTRELVGRGFDVVGVDPSEPMIRAATDMFSDPSFQVADAANLPFESDTFEYALFSSYGLDYVHPEAERLAALEEIHRVLTPGGVFAFNTHNSWYNLPALLLDRPFLKRLYIKSGNLLRLASPYKIAGHEFDVATYISNPYRQRSQLRSCGFELLACVGKRSAPLKYLERGPYFVART